MIIRGGGGGVIDLFDLFEVRIAAVELHGHIGGRRGGDARTTVGLSGGGKSGLIGGLVDLLKLFFILIFIIAVVVFIVLRSLFLIRLVLVLVLLLLLRLGRIVSNRVKVLRLDGLGLVDGLFGV